MFDRRYTPTVDVLLSECAWLQERVSTLEAALEKLITRADDVPVVVANENQRHRVNLFSYAVEDARAALSAALPDIASGGGRTRERGDR